MGRVRTSPYTVADVEDGTLRKFFSNVFLLMAAGLGVTGLIAGWLSHDTAALSSLFHVYDVVGKNGKTTQQYGISFWWGVAAVAELGLVFGLARWTAIRESGKAMGLSLFAIFAGLNGVTLAPVIYAYTDASVALTFFVTAATFGAAAGIGHTTKINLLKMSSFLLMGLIGLIIALVVNMFLRSSAMGFMISVVGVLLFTVLTAFDMQRLRAYYDEMGSTDGLVVYGALTLYLDFINLFLYLLRFFGVRK